MTKLEWSLQFVKMKIQEMVCLFFRTSRCLCNALDARYLTGGRRISVALLLSAPRVRLPFTLSCLEATMRPTVCSPKITLISKQKPTISSMKRTEDTNTLQNTFQLGNQMPVHSPNWMSFKHQRLQGTVSSLSSCPFLHAFINSTTWLLPTAIDGLIVGIETQDVYLDKKRTWTRKIVLVTDGESPMEIEEWEAIAKKMSNLNISLTVV